LHELHVIVENIVRERCETSEVHLPAPTSSPILNAIKELAEELDVVGKSQVAEPSVVVVVDSFAEVSQMAEEVVIDATQ
jgi:hypothetical protein